MQLFLVPYSFFVFLLLEETFVQVQALQLHSEGSQVLACLTQSTHSPVLQPDLPLWKALRVNI